MSAVIAVRNLRKSFGALTVTDAIDLEVASGEIHALIGPNGAGKTSLVHQIAGSLEPDAGNIYLNGQDITRLPAHARARLGLARSFQIPSLVPGWSVAENMALAARVTNGTRLNLFRNTKQEAQIAADVANLLARIGLTNRTATAADALSHGEKRALEIGLALALRPKALLLDEPLAGTGPEEAERIVKLIAGLRADHAILLIEHDMSAVFALADKISVLVEGRIVASGSPNDVRSSPLARAAYLGSEADFGISS
jgi:branched-chain amino acid transport system ATP-binding protein